MVPNKTTGKREITLKPPDMPTDVPVAGDIKNTIIFSLLVVIALMIIGFAVFILAGQQKSNSTDQPVSALKSPAPASSVNTTSPKKEDVSQRLEAESLLEEVILLGQSEDLKGMQNWAPVSYQNLQEKIAKGNEAYAKEQFIEASSFYQQSIDDFNILIEEKPLLFNQALNEGAFHLSERDAAAALASYQKALMLEPENATVLTGQEDATLLLETLRLVEMGEQYLSSGDIEKAWNVFKEAHENNPSDNPTRESFLKIDAVNNQRVKQEALKLFYDLLDSDQFDQATSQLDTAILASGINTETIQAKKQLQMQQELFLLHGYKNGGAEASRQENWREAANIYKKALQLDPHVDFALKGLEDAESRGKLMTRLQQFLESKTKLGEKSILENAKSTLQYSSQFDSHGPKATAAIEELKSYVSKYQTPVTLTIFSDNFTEVTIYHVGKLGRFFTRELTLRPGQYTITGNRQGFRNVRYQLELTPENRQVEFTVICRERF